MDARQIELLAGRLLRGELTTSAFVEAISDSHIADLGFANLDLDRPRRCGFPEVIYGEGKTPEAIERICRELSPRGGHDVFATRIAAAQAETLKAAFPQGIYNPLGRTFRIPLERASDLRDQGGRVVIVTAGTSDRPVAEEARETALWMGAEVQVIQDLGVAGPHRLLAHVDELRAADAVVVVAGMEGALPSVVGGHVACPVVAVPTSVGYGASFGGVAALFAMVNSCAANVTVVNIDSGFKGAYVAGLIARGAAAKRSAP